MSANNSTTGKVAFERKALVLLQAAVVGWLVFVVFCLGMTLIAALKANSLNPWGVLLLFTVASGIVIFAVWLAFVVPVALVPSESFFWKPGTLLLTGAFTGPLLVCLNQIYEIWRNPTITIYDMQAYLFGDVVLPCIPSALIGGFIGWTAGCLYRRLLNTSS